MKLVESESNTLHVFFVSSPIVQIVSHLIITRLGLKPKDIVIVALRQADTSLLEGQKYVLSSVKGDHICRKILNFSYSDLKMKSWLERLGKPFYIYTTWFNEITEILVSSKLCKGHYYMEEGQLAYYKNKEFSSIDNLPAKARRKLKSEGSNDYHYRDDALGYFGISEKSFSNIAADRRVVLGDFSSLIDLYNFRLRDVERIGVFPAPHRINKDKIGEVVDAYLMHVGLAGALKPHPGFFAYPHMLDSLKFELTCRGYDLNLLCQSDVLLEVEMMGAPKRLFGARSSLSAYAEHFGSCYQVISISGYTPPIN